MAAAVGRACWCWSASSTTASTQTTQLRLRVVREPSYTRVCSAGPRFPSGSCNGKIVMARYFTAAVLPLDASHNLSPFDADGSHVASIAVGNRGVPVVVGGAMYGLASGMAPSARLAVYKAMYPDEADTEERAQAGRAHARRPDMRGLEHDQRRMLAGHHFAMIVSRASETGSLDHVVRLPLAVRSKLQPHD